MPCGESEWSAVWRKINVFHLLRSNVLLDNPRGRTPNFMHAPRVQTEALFKTANKRSMRNATESLLPVPPKPSSRQTEPKAIDVWIGEVVDEEEHFQQKRRIDSYISLNKNFISHPVGPMASVFFGEPAKVPDAMSMSCSLISEMHSFCVVCSCLSMLMESRVLSLFV